MEISTVDYYSIISYFSTRDTTMNTPENANLPACLGRMLDEADYTKFFPPLSGEQKKRLLFVESGIEKVSEQVLRIYRFAQRTQNTELLELLNEQFEFGADVP